MNQLWKSSIQTDQTAGTYFLSAAKQFQKIGDDTNLLEAAGCYEDAYKAFQQMKQTGMRFIEY